MQCIDKLHNDDVFHEGACQSCGSRLFQSEPCCREGEGDIPACSDNVTQRRTSGGTLTYICDFHRLALEERLEAIARRYPEVNHPEGCSCYGCSEGSW